MPDHVRLLRRTDGREMPTHDWVQVPKPEPGSSCDRRCRKCGMEADNPGRTSGGRNPELCFVAQLGTCEGCKRPSMALLFEDDVMFSGRYCCECLNPEFGVRSSPNPYGGTADGACQPNPPGAPAVSQLSPDTGRERPCVESGCGHARWHHEGGKRCEMCSCDEFRTRGNSRPN
jgi:hypothetical protein